MIYKTIRKFISRMTWRYQTYLNEQDCYWYFNQYYNEESCAIEFAAICADSNIVKIQEILIGSTSAMDAVARAYKGFSVISK